MPGTPIKVIKVGHSAQPRIAQAWYVLHAISEVLADSQSDRCRSKKIRCDGIRPSCTQCINVGFECVTSDKLSRRAFPRGYTESLEEKVRDLEHKLKQKGASNSPTPSPEEGKPQDGEVFLVIQDAWLLLGNGRLGDYPGLSSARVLGDILAKRLSDAGDPIRPTHFDQAFRGRPTRKQLQCPVPWDVPARETCDRLMRIFFTEFAQLYPIVHRPTLVNMYKSYISNPSAQHSPTVITHVNLAFCIAALSPQSGVTEEVKEKFEDRWTQAMDYATADGSITALQCLALAFLYTLKRADYTRVAKYRGMTVGLCQNLGLHRPQRKLLANVLGTEMRKRLFWSIFVLDGFSSSHLGLPPLLDNEASQCEYPANVVDECTPTQFTPPGITKLHGEMTYARPLFHLTRILSNILKGMYSPASSYEVPVRRVASAKKALDSWLSEFESRVQCGSRALQLAHEYVRSILYRVPVVACDDSPNGAAKSFAARVGSCSRNAVRLLQALHEEHIVFPCPLNDEEIWLQTGLGVLLEASFNQLDDEDTEQGAELLVAVQERIAGHEQGAKLDAILGPLSNDHNANVEQVSEILTRLGQTSSAHQRHGSPRCRKDSKQRRSKRDTYKAAQQSQTMSDAGPVSRNRQLMMFQLSGNKQMTNPEDWQHMLSGLDNGPMTIYDGIYGGGMDSAQALTTTDYSSHSSGSPPSAFDTQMTIQHSEVDMLSSSWPISPTMDLSYPPSSVVDHQHLSTNGGMYGGSIVIPQVDTNHIGLDANMGIFDNMSSGFGV